MKKTGNILKARSDREDCHTSHLWQLGLSILQNHCLQSVKELGLAQWKGFLTEETAENSFPPAVHTVTWLLLNSHIRINNEKLKHLQYLYFPLEKQMQLHAPKTITCDQHTVQKWSKFCKFLRDMDSSNSKIVCVVLGYTMTLRKYRLPL